jgi:hypothetical protein
MTTVNSNTTTCIAFAISDMHSLLDNALEIEQESLKNIIREMLSKETVEVINPNSFFSRKIRIPKYDESELDGLVTEYMTSQNSAFKENLFSVVDWLKSFKESFEYTEKSYIWLSLDDFFVIKFLNDVGIEYSLAGHLVVANYGQFRTYISGDRFYNRMREVRLLVR